MTHEQLHAYAQRYVGVLLMDKQARDKLQTSDHVALLNEVLKPDEPITEADAKEIQEHAASNLQEFCNAVKSARPGETDDVLETYMDGFSKYPPRY